MWLFILVISININKGIIMNSDAQKLVGRKVNMIVIDNEEHMGGEVFKYKEYELKDPDFENEVNNINPNNRIFTPNTGGTMDHKPFRLNVYIDENGVVTEVRNG